MLSHSHSKYGSLKIIDRNGGDPLKFLFKDGAHNTLARVEY